MPDRAALPVPEGRPELGVEYIAPRTPVEELLAGIWADVLGLDRVGVEDNFFELGGDSLSAVALADTFAQMDIPLTIGDVFEYQSVAELATLTEARRLDERR